MQIFRVLSWTYLIYIFLLGALKLTMQPDKVILMYQPKTHGQWIEKIAFDVLPVIVDDSEKILFKIFIYIYLYYMKKCIS